MNRWTVAALLALVALCSSAWWGANLDRQRPNLATCLASPAKFRGTPIAILRESHVTAVYPDGTLQVLEKGLNARCHVINAPPATTGDPIAVEGRFEPPDRVIAENAHVHHARFYRISSSVLAVAWMGLILYRRFSLGPAGLEEARA
jgi:hypothetical protein